MDWQHLLVILCLAAAVAYVAARAWRTWARKGAGCGGGCGCATKAPPREGGLIAADDLTTRVRRR